MEVTEETEFKKAPSDSPQVEEYVGKEGEGDIPRAALVGELPDPVGVEEYQPPSGPPPESPEEYFEGEGERKTEEPMEEVEFEDPEDVRV